MYIIEEDCQKCHSRNSTMSKAITSMPFSSHEDLTEYVEGGYSWKYMAQTAHTHLFGMANFLALVTLAFAFTSYIGSIKTLLIGLSWLGLWVDISSWWLAKYSDVFAYVIAGSGTVVIGSVVAMSGLSLLNMWFKLPAVVLEKPQKQD